MTYQKVRARLRPSSESEYAYDRRWLALMTSSAKSEHAYDLTVTNSDDSENLRLRPTKGRRTLQSHLRPCTWWRTEWDHFTCDLMQVEWFFSLTYDRVCGGGLE